MIVNQNKKVLSGGFSHRKCSVMSNIKANNRPTKKNISNPFIKALT
jgi:hypothetical protein